MLALDKPKPKICWNLVRGNSSTSCQKSVRPVKPVSPAVVWPRASQVMITPDTVMTAIDAVTTPTVKTLRTRALMVNRLRPATSKPATRAASAVLVCVRRRMAREKPTPARAGRPFSRRASQSTIVSPAVTAAYWATCVAAIGQTTPDSLPSKWRAFPGATRRPSSTEPSAT